MRQMAGWLTVVFLCCAAGAANGEAQPDARLQQARTAFDEANTLWDAGKYVLGGSHPDVARSLDLLGFHHLLQGNPARAEPLLRRALAIRGATFGENHPRNAETLNHLAVVHLAQHRLAEALPLLKRAFTMSEQRLRQEALGFSEVQMARFLQFPRTDEERLYALLRPHPDNAHVRRLALGAALLLKGRSVEESSNISRTLYRSLSAQDRDTLERSSPVGSS